MKSIKILDIEKNTHEVVSEASVLLVDEPVIIFQDTAGKTYRIEAFEYDWGSYTQANDEELEQFSKWLKHRKYDDYEPITENWFKNEFNQFWEEEIN